MSSSTRLQIWLIWLYFSKSWSQSFLDLFGNCTDPSVSPFKIDMDSFMNSSESTHLQKLSTCVANQGSRVCSTVAAHLKASKLMSEAFSDLVSSAKKSIQSTRNRKMEQTRGNQCLWTTPMVLRWGGPQVMFACMICSTTFRPKSWCQHSMVYFAVLKCPARNGPAHICPSIPSYW